jgi:Holliday junction resolvasome RuvABC endonuclease subunit
MNYMFTIGIDPGFRRTALCMLQHGGPKPVLVALQSREQDKEDAGLSWPQRALSIARWCVSQVSSLEYHAGCKYQARIAVEHIQYHGGQNGQIAIQCSLLVGAIVTGLLWDIHSNHDARVCTISPSTWRAQVLGRANIKTPTDAHLREVIDFGDYKKRTNDDLRDAVAIALWAAQH